MLLLALDTSTRQASVSLTTEDALLGEYTWHIGNNHSVELLERIQRLLTECATSMHEIDGIAVASGPGSFNGVRVALATAKTLAFTLKKPLVGVSTLDIVAAQQRQWTGPICAVLEAGRAELYTACYLFETLSDESNAVTYQMRRLCDYQVLLPEQLANVLQEQGGAWFGVPAEPQLPPVLFCGEMSAASRQALATSMQQQCLFVDGAQSARHASSLALLAMQRLREGKEDDPLLLEPLYLRRPSITTSTRKQPLLGSTSTGQSKTEREDGALRH